VRRQLAHQTLNRLPHERDSQQALAHNDLRRNAQHMVPEPSKIPVATRILSAPLRVNRPIHLHHQAERGRDEVRYVSIPEHELPAKGNTKPPATQLLPKQELRTLREAPHVMRPGGEQALASFSD